MKTLEAFHHTCLGLWQAPSPLPRSRMLKPMLPPAESGYHRKDEPTVEIQPWIGRANLGRTNRIQQRQPQILDVHSSLLNIQHVPHLHVRLSAHRFSELKKMALLWRRNHKLIASCCALWWWAGNATSRSCRLQLDRCHDKRAHCKYHGTQDIISYQCLRPGSKVIGILVISWLLFKW
jgi:hypothetical protein